eukprot:2266317-Amphidinium_carterae.1
MANVLSLSTQNRSSVHEMVGLMVIWPIMGELCCSSLFPVVLTMLSSAMKLWRHGFADRSMPQIAMT